MTTRVTVIAALLLVAACSSSKRLESVPADTTPSTTVTTEAPTTTAAPTTTEAPTTTAAPTTTEAPTTTTVAPDYTLRADGIGTWVFTDPSASVIEALTAAFGAPATDVASAFPDEAGPGDYRNDQEEGFLLPFGRTVCFANTLCTVHGGNSPDALSFVGWYYAGEEPGTLTTAAGVTLGSRWADFPDAITVAEGGCYSDGGGTTTDGVALALRSSGLQFTAVDDAGNFVTNTPDPADVTVVQMQAGSQIAQFYGDC